MVVACRGILVHLQGGAACEERYRRPLSAASEAGVNARSRPRRRWPREISTVWTHFLAAGAFNLPEAVVEFRRFRRKGISALSNSTEVSYLSRFFAKFVEISAASIATAVCAYAIAHLAGPLSAPAPTSASQNAAGDARPLASSPVAPAPVVAVDATGAAPQPVGDAPPAQSRTAMKASAPPVPAPKDKESKTVRGEKSAEALARAALANIDADRPAAADAPIRRKSPTASPAVTAAIEVQPRPAVAAPRAADIQPAPVAPAAPGPEARGAVIQAPPNAAPLPETAARPPEPPAEEEKDLFSVLARVPDLLRPATPSLAGDAPRPPLPVGTVSSD